MTEHPKLNNEAVWERICRTQYSDAVTEAEEEISALFARVRAGDLAALNRLEDVAGLKAALTAQAAWIDGFLCGRSPERLVFADAPPAQPEVHP